MGREPGPRYGGIIQISSPCQIRGKVMKRAVLYLRVGWQSCCLSVRALWSLGRLQSELFWRGVVYHEHIDPVLGMPTSGRRRPWK